MSQLPSSLHSHRKVTVLLDGLLPGLSPPYPAAMLTSEKLMDTGRICHLWVSGPARFLG